MIYAVDFDGTILLKNNKPNIVLIKHLIQLQRQGNELILWTCREGKELIEAVGYCQRYGLRFNAINNNIPRVISKYGNSRKVYADYYIDDKAIK